MYLYADSLNLLTVVSLMETSSVVIKVGLRHVNILYSVEFSL